MITAKIYELLFLITAVVSIVGMPIMAYFVITRNRRRKQIGLQGVQLLAGKCPVCGGKIKQYDIIGKGKPELYGPIVGAVRCTRCGHIEVFTPQEIQNPRQHP